MDFKTLLQASFKSKDTEEWLDVHFTRPIGLILALACKALKIHPNTITIISLLLGAASGFMFYHSDLNHNLIGILLLMVANFLDSTDGQLARLTGQKTLLGRILDGLAGDVWFFCIYFAICCRLMHDNIPFIHTEWGIWIWILAFVAGFFFHSPQCSLADYYRQIHLLFIKGKEESELCKARNRTRDTQNTIFQAMVSILIPLQLCLLLPQSRTPNARISKTQTNG